MLTVAEHVERWERELRRAHAEDVGSLGSRARVLRAESALRYWRALGWGEARKVSA